MVLCELCYFIIDVFRNSKKLGILIILLSWGQIILSQQKEDATMYSLEEGLPSRQILWVVLDDAGFLWLGTPNGISRFDGYDFLNFDAKNTLGLTDQNILSMAVTDSLLWLGTSSGIFAFNLNTYKASRLDGVSGEVKELFLDKKRRLWFADVKGNIKVLEGENIRQVQAHYNHPWTKSTVNLMASHGVNDDGVWWGRLDGSIFLYKNKEEPLEVLLDGTILKKRGAPHFTTDSTVIFFSTDGAFRKNIRTNRTQTIPHAPVGRGQISQVVNENILFHIDGKNEVYEISISDNSNQQNQYLTDLLSGTAGVNQLLINQNIWWIATNSGLLKLIRRPQLFQRVLNDKSASVRSILKYGQDQSLVSTYKGLYYLNKEHQVEYWNNYPYKVFHNYFYDKSGILWGLEESRGLMKLDASLTKFENLTPDDDHLWFQYAIPFQNKVYLGSSKGLYEHDIVSKTMDLVRDSVSGISLVSNVFDLQLENEKLWIATSIGLYVLETESRSIRGIPELKGITIRDIHATQDGILWLGTEGKGLMGFDPLSQQIQRYDHSDGLCNNTINVITSSQEDQFIWVGTNNGLSCVDRESETLVNYYEEDGIAHNEFNRKALTTDSKGNIWIGGLDGITIFDPTEFTLDETTPPSLLLIRVGKYDGDKDKMIFSARNLINQRTFDYNPDDRLFQFRFALNDFKASDKNKFRYKIDGLHQDWVNISNQRELLIDNLSPGTYTLKIAGTSGRGSWSAPLELSLSMEYAFYQTIWFYLVILAGLVFIGIAIHKVRTAQLLKIERVRARIARDLHDELGSTLTRISMFSELAETSNGKTKYLKDVASMSRDASSTLSDIVWSIDNIDDTMSALLERIKDHLYKMVQPTKMEYKFSVEGMDEESQLKAEVKQNLFLIAKEAINNSVKYSNGSLLSVLFDQKDGWLTMNISDNGGVEQEIRKGGNGLRNMQIRTESIGGRYELSTRNGFCILVSVPV